MNVKLLGKLSVPAALASVADGDTNELTGAQGIVAKAAEPPPAQAAPAPAAAITTGCDPSYPDVCIPPSPPDLDCGDIGERRFTVLQPDPHRFDGDTDGIGCERG